MSWAKGPAHLNISWPKPAATGRELIHVLHVIKRNKGSSVEGGRLPGLRALLGYHY